MLWDKKPWAKKGVVIYENGKWKIAEDDYKAIVEYVLSDDYGPNKLIDGTGYFPETWDELVGVIKDGLSIQGLHHIILTYYPIYLVYIENGEVKIKDVILLNDTLPEYVFLFPISNHPDGTDLDPVKEINGFLRSISA